MVKIAVLITSHNRAFVTHRCIDRLINIAKNYDFDIFLVDDNSNDCTVEIIRESFPFVHIISGSGDLYWTRGMHLAWSVASKGDYSYYLWLNDDVVLYENFLENLLLCSSRYYDRAIISGILESHDKTEILYGGFSKSKKILSPNGCVQPIHYLNGNLVLVPRFVFDILGNFDDRLHHDLGDVDYGLRAIKLRIPVFTSINVLGSCNTNKLCRFRLWGASFSERIRKLYSPLGSNPFVYFYFRRKHYGFISALFYFVYLHIINMLPDFIVGIIFKRKYTI